LKANEGTSSYTHFLWDMLVFNRVKMALGGRLKCMVVGSAPMDVNTTKYLQAVLCTRIVQGFGMTELNSFGMAEIMCAPISNSCGPPMPGTSVRLRDCPEMDYITTDQPCPRGELLLKSDAVMSGYYKNEDQTKEMFEDGWLCSGDIAQINPNGTISIIDRCKNIFKLTQGEYIAPDYLQVVYDRHSLVHQTFVHGNSNRSALVAIVVPDPETFVPWAQKIISNSSAELVELNLNQQVNEALLKSLMKHGCERKLQGFEIVHAIYIDPMPFDINRNQLLSSIFKLKHHFASQYYRETIDKLYDSLLA
ncbi:medium-chain fatty acid-CoA ligase faa2, partial [Linderina macrospora]